MKKPVILIGLVLTFCAANAEEKKKTIYKYTDENGVTHYTETKPNENYQEADLPQLSVVPSAPVKDQTSSSSEPKDTKPVEELKFKILSPVNDENIWGTGLKLTAKATPLSEAQQNQYQIQFVIDGQKQKPSDKSTQEFENIFRGSHEIQALMIKRDTREVVRKSKKVTFFMHQNTKK